MFNSSGGMKLKFQPPPGEWIKCGLTNYPLVPRWSNVSCPAGNTRPQPQILNLPHTQAYITPSGWQQDWTRPIKRPKYEIFCTQACFANHLWHQDCRNFEAIFQTESSFSFLPGKENILALNRIGLQMGLRDKMGVRSRRESGKHFGYFPWGALSWWGNLLHVQGLGILKIGLKMLKRHHKNLLRIKSGRGELPQLLSTWFSWKSAQEERSTN